MRRKTGILACVCAVLMCVPSSAAGDSEVQAAKTSERFAMTVPEEWVQRDGGILLSPPSSWDDPGFSITFVPETEKPGR